MKAPKFSTLVRMCVTLVFISGHGKECVLAQAACMANSQPLQGDVNVKRREYHQFLVTDATQFLGGERLSIVVSGQVDVNFQEHHDRHCNLFGFLDCHTDDWIEHHTKTPDQEPLTVRLVDDAGNTSGGLAPQFAATTSPLVIDVPSTPFDKPYHLEAWLSDTSINGSQSSGQYTVSVTIDGTGRNAALAANLNHSPPLTASQIDTPQILDTNFVRGCAAPIAEQLARHATKFPATQADTRDAQLALLKLALRLDPANPSITLALADYYRQTGNLALAKKTASDALDATEKAVALNPTRGNKQKRANAYLEVGKTIEEERASLNAADLEDALTYYSRSAQEFESIHDLTGLPESLVRKARALRRMRTESSLAASTQAYQHALDILPRRLNKTSFVSVSPDHKYMLVAKRLSSIGIGSLGNSLAPVDLPGDYTILGQDQSGRLLLRNPDTLLWYDPDKPNLPPSLAASRVLHSAAASNGTILGEGDDKHLILIGSNGVDRDVFSNEKGIFPLIFSLSGDGRTFAYYDGSQILVKKVGSSSDAIVRTIVQPDLKNMFSLALSPDGGKIVAIEETSANRVIRLWSTSDQSAGVDVSSIPSGSGYVSGISFSPDGSTIAFGYKAGELDIAQAKAPYSVQTYSLTPSNIAVGWPYWINSQAIVVVTLSGAFNLVDIQSGSASDISSKVNIPLGSIPWFYQEPSGIRVAANSYAAKLQCYSLPDVSLAWEKQFSDVDPTKALILSGGRYLLAYAQNGKSVNAIDLSSNTVKSVPFEASTLAFAVAGLNTAQWYFGQPHPDGSLSLDVFSGTETKTSITFQPPVTRFGQSLQEVQQQPVGQSSVQGAITAWYVVPAFGNDNRRLAIAPSVWFQMPAPAAPAPAFKPILAWHTDFRVAGTGLDSACTVTDSVAGPLVNVRIPVVTVDDNGVVQCKDFTLPSFGFAPVGFSSYQSGHLLFAEQFSSGLFMTSSAGGTGVKTVIAANNMASKESSMGDKIMSLVQVSPNTYSVILSSVAADGSITSVPCTQCAGLDISTYRQRMQKEVPYNPFISTWPTETLGRSILDLPDTMSFVALVSGGEVQIEDVSNDSIALSMPLAEPVYQDDRCLVMRDGTDLEVALLKH